MNSTLTKVMSGISVTCQRINFVYMDLLFVCTFVLGKFTKQSLRGHRSVKKFDVEVMMD